jgi:hypothetical protein
MISRPFPGDSLRTHPTQPLTKDELDEVLHALEVPFDSMLVQWRVTEWSEDRTRGLMMAYADPRAYSDRLNGLLTPAGWTRKYTVQASPPVQRSERGAAARVIRPSISTIASPPRAIRRASSFCRHRGLCSKCRTRWSQN